MPPIEKCFRIFRKTWLQGPFLVFSYFVFIPSKVFTAYGSFEISITVTLWRICEQLFQVLFHFVNPQVLIYVFKAFSYFSLLQLALFPPQALVSPVADVLRQKLSVVAWGRRGLGLPVKDKNKQDTVREIHFGFGVLVIAVTVLFFSLLYEK